MAKKGQRFLKYTDEYRQGIINKLRSGTPATHLSKEYEIPLYTIKTWKRKFINHPELYLNAGQKTGRPKESEIDYKERYQILKKYRAFLKAQRERK